jgi:hypothetical protein
MMSGRDAIIRMMRRQGRRDVLALLVLAAAVGCDFQPDPPPGPTAVPPGRFVSVTVQYRQPAGCANSEGTCGARVVFFGSWMAPGQEVLLDTSTGPNFWTGVVANVPVNWPPTDTPHYVRIYDPHLKDTPTGGVTAARLLVGGQAIYNIDSPGTPQESGLIYVDDNGVGRNPL